MANTYTSIRAATLQNRAAFYEACARLFNHMDALNLNVISVVRNGDNTVTFTLSGPLPAEQLAHLEVQ